MPDLTIAPRDLDAMTPVELLPGYFALVPATARLRGVPRAGLNLRIEIEQDGPRIRPALIGVEADPGEEVGAADWRKVRPAEAWRDVATRVVERGEPGSLPDWTETSPSMNPSQDIVVRLRQQGPTEETLRFVADRYNLARAISVPPALFVQEAFSAGGVVEHLPRTTATKWIRRARDAGLIRGDD